MERDGSLAKMHKKEAAAIKREMLRMARNFEGLLEFRNIPGALVVIDTASRVLPGADENLQKDMTLFVKACDHIRETFHCAVLAVHHLSRNGNGTMRGSTVFDGAADFIVLVEREPGDMFGTISAKKIKAAADGWSIEFTVKEVEVVPGIDPKTSLYIERSKTKSTFDPGFGGQQETGFVQAGPLKLTLEERDKILSAIKEDWDNFQPWTMAGRMKNDFRYASRRFRTIYGKRLTDQTAHAVLGFFIDQGWINENICRKKDHLKGLELVKDVRRNGQAHGENENR
jgi:hypothetical protein